MNNIMSRESERKVNLPVASYLLLSPFVAAIGSWLWFQNTYNQNTIVLSFVLFCIIELAITAGYHRLYSHQSYKAHPVVELAILFFGASALQGSALKWSIDHRIHHKYVDDNEKDPYSIGLGFLWAHMGWLIYKEDDQLNALPANDLKSNKLVMLQDKIEVPMGLVGAILVPGLIAMAWGDFWGGVFVAGFLRSVVNHHSTFLINSLAHCVGSQNYSDKHSARDNWFAAFLTFGEGFHNFHHEFGSDYRNGVRFFDWDPSKWLIYGLSLFGLTWDLKRTREDIIIRARLKMKQKKLQAKLAKANSSENFQVKAGRMLERIRRRIELNTRKMTKLQNEYKALLAEQTEANYKLIQDKLDDLQYAIKDLSYEFSYLMSRWNGFSSRLVRSAV